MSTGFYDRRILIGIAVLTFVVLGCTCTLPLARTSVPATPTPVVVVVTATPEATRPAEQPPAGVVASQEQVVIDIYKRVSPGVVFIEVLDEDDPEGGGSGSGFVYDGEGHIVTNAHVVREADLIRVYFSDDTVAQAEVLGSDSDADLAVLQIDLPSEVLTPLPIGSSANLQVGRWLSPSETPTATNAR